MNTPASPSPAQTSRALIIDDEADICELAEITLSRMGIDTRSAHDLAQARALLESTEFNLCITDMNLPDGNGIELVEYIQQHYPTIPVAVITAYGNMESAVRALKAGAFDFVSKPIDLQVFRELVHSAIKLGAAPEAAITPASSRLNLLGQSRQTRQLRDKISKLARSQAPVFIQGESGTGKELTARLIHDQSIRRENPFIAINCGAIPGELMESEFFGHKKGSFTGATTDKTGLFMAADKGTLFLDEVADLPLHMQVKLLRAIQEKSIRPIGELEEKPVDVRILSASHKNLAALVAQGKFREDLYYRINVIELNVPALRDRAEDIPELVAHQLKQIAAKSALTEIPELSRQALLKLMQYPFPGNVRELENILERALALIEGNTIEEDDLILPEIAPAPASPTANPPASAGKTEAAMDLDINSQQKELIEQALQKTRWNKTAAAKLLGLTPRQLSYRIQKLGID